MAFFASRKENKIGALYTSAGSGMARYQTFPAGTKIFEKKKPRDCAYIIDTGRVEITDVMEGSGNFHLGPGEIFGETALIDDGPRTASAIAVEETSVFLIPRKVIENRLEGLDPLISLFIALLIERYKVTRIYLPESIKQEESDNLIEKIKKSKGMPAKLLTILDAQEQKQIALQELQMEQELRGALAEKQFIPFLQPILDLKTREVIGFEALIRWQHPERGIVGPFEFVPTAERTNVVQLLDTMMLEKACENVGRLIQAAGKDIFISVNLSGINFGTIDIVQTVKDVLRQYKTDPSHIRLEITESALIDDPSQAEEVLQGLKELGLCIALDDFGTGYSSLSYLHKFSIDTIKIDRAFITNIDQEQKSLDIVKAISGLARTFKLKTVAEGIERDEEALALSAIGCDMAQGYLFGKPMALSDAEELLQKQKA